MFFPHLLAPSGNITANFDVSENKSMTAVLLSGDVTTDMGGQNYPIVDMYFRFNGTEGAEGFAHQVTYYDKDSTGYFTFSTNDFPFTSAWYVTLNQLLQKLPATGTATIQFHSSISMEVNYNITLNGESKTGRELLSWNGIVATYQLYTDQGRIISVKYDFASVFLFLEIEKQET
jgi:hypothetical protein